MREEEEVVVVYSSTLPVGTSTWFAGREHSEESKGADA